MEQTFDYVGHPNDFVGPLQVGLYNWHSMEGHRIGLSVVTAGGYEILAWAGTEEEQRARYEQQCRTIEGRGQRMLRTTHQTRRLLGEIWDESMSH